MPGYLDSWTLGTSDIPNFEHQTARAPGLSDLQALGHSGIRTSADLGHSQF